jgi:hydrogenase maturation protease
MNTSLVDKIAEAILYEGYILYPYRASSQKNQERFTFGRVYPEAYSAAQDGAEPFFMQTQCLVRRTGGEGSFAGRVRFLHPMAREICATSPSGEPGEVIPELRIDDHVLQTWHEAVERVVLIPEIPLDAASRRLAEFAFPSSNATTQLEDKSGRLRGFVRRCQDALQGHIEIVVEPLETGDLAKLTVRISNHTPMPAADAQNSEALLLRTFASTHAILLANHAEFVSLTDTPPADSLAAMSCENIGTWPVLVGDQEKQERDTILSSPIILYDYPQLAPESHGDLHDGLEIDEILTLRIMTMTDAEKNEMRSVDEFARRILERTESMPEGGLMKMHGTMREVSLPHGDFFDADTRLDSACLQGAPLHQGDRVRIHPKGRADAMDLMLSGKIGVIESIEQDADQRVHLALVLEDDPGRDLGMMRQPGHRFFYTLDEVEPLREAG